MMTIDRSAKAFALHLRERCVRLGARAFRRAAIVAAIAAAPAVLVAQIPADAWPTYHGDYTGRRFSTLKQINTTNVKNLTLAWVYRINTSRAGAIVGGEGPDTPPPGGSTPSIKSTPLMLNGILYFSVPDHVYALDVRTGREIWHYAWKTRGGDHIGNRGVGILDRWLYFLTPDNYFVSLDLATGKERWHHEIANMKREYFSTNAPMVIGRQVIIGVGGDALDIPGYLESRDPESGNLIWRWNTTPRPGDPGANSWPDEDAMLHGGGMPWIPGTYDPELNLYYFGTGNPQPVLAGFSRPGDNLYTCTIVALNPNTGKMAWYYQVTPHDTHDWDAAQTPILIDGEFNGRPRKMVAQASRNGHYFLLDRVTGEHLVTSKFIDSLNWTKGINPKGQPMHDPAKDASVPGTLVSPDTSGATNWPPPSFNPETGLLYFGTRQAFSVMYLTDTDGRPQGWAAAERNVGIVGNALKAVDYKTGQVKWSRPLMMGPGGSAGGPMGLLSTSGGLLFGNDGGPNFVAYEASSGKPIWHAGVGATTSNGPQTFMVDGRQFIVVGAGDTLYAFALQ